MTSGSIRIAAPAKLNLFLHVTGKCPDGYHLLESLIVFTGFGDVLECTPAERLTLTAGGPFASALAGDMENNLILRAARLLGEHSGCRSGAHITLHKQIPVGAGLGGGSSDAASALLALRSLWNLSVSDEDMQRLALQLGSDVPVCLARRPAWVRGIGEDVIPIDAYDGFWVVLVNPGSPLPTADVFRRFSHGFSPSMTMPSLASPEALLTFLKAQHNALEAPAIALQPAITEVLAAIAATDGCLLSRLTGSGATCFGIYADALHARQALRWIQRQQPAWWGIASELYDERKAAA